MSLDTLQKKEVGEPAIPQNWAVPDFINAVWIWVDQLVQWLGEFFNQFVQTWWVKQETKETWEETPSFLELLKAKSGNKTEFSTFLKKDLTSQKLKELNDEEKIQVIELILKNDCREGLWYDEIVSITLSLKNKEESKLRSIKIFNIYISNRGQLKKPTDNTDNQGIASKWEKEKIQDAESIAFSQETTLEFITNYLSEQGKIEEKTPTFLDQLKAKKGDELEWALTHLIFWKQDTLNSLSDEEKIQVIEIILNIFPQKCSGIVHIFNLLEEENRLKVIKIFKKNILSNIEQLNNFSYVKQSDDELKVFKNIYLTQTNILDLLINNLEENKSKLEAIIYCEFYLTDKNNKNIPSERLNIIYPSFVSQQILGMSDNEKLTIFEWLEKPDFLKKEETESEVKTYEGKEIFDILSLDQKIEIILSMEDRELRTRAVKTLPIQEKIKFWKEQFLAWDYGWDWEN
jgi:hypothetical protein